MSDEDVMEFLEPKYNLCIAEDAFDKFQAVSMYKAKEYLTLPKNVPPDPNIVPTDDNNVASSSFSELNSPVSSTMICGNNIEQSKKSPVQSNNSLGNSSGVLDDSDMVVSNSENLHQENTTAEALTNNVRPRKRGRKPKKNLVSPVQESSADTSQSIQNPDISSTPFSLYPETSDIIKTVRTRGRPKRVISTEPLNIVNDNLKESMADNQSDHSCAKKPRGGKRGRPRGSGSRLPIRANTEILEQPLVIQNQPNEDQPTQDIDQITHSENIKLSNKTSRKSKKSQILAPTDLEKTDDKNSLSHDDPDDICLSKLKDIPAKSNITNLTENISSDNEKSFEYLNNTSSEILEDQLPKVKKRRGRPKGSKAIQSAAISLSQHIEVLDKLPLKKNNDIDDDGDNICLSKLKSSNNDNINLEYENTVDMTTNHIKNIDETNIECKDETIPETNDTQTINKENIELHQVTDKESNDIIGIPGSSSEIQISDIEQSHVETNGTPSKRSTKMPVMADFEYNIDSVIEPDNAKVTSQATDGTSAVEETLKRPVRRKVKKLQYEEESDEDPFANVELSDDEPMRGRRGNKYYSDDEYFPGKRGKSAIDSTDTEVSDSNLGTELDKSRKHKKKKFRKKSDNLSPRKRGRKEEESSINTSDVSVIEQECVQSVESEISLVPPDKTVDTVSQQSQLLQKWGNSTEFENFIAKKIHGTSLKIKKVDKSGDSNKIDIPVIDPEAKKTIEMCTQTTIIPTLSTAVQTTSPYHVPLKENVPLTPEQSEKACYFLNSIVQTTAEVGTLMIQKSQDFIKKKINTNHVTDTAAMDYCVKKSFLLFKLAKHNLRQMEEDLEKQYDEFLKVNNLTKCKEEQKQILPTHKEKKESNSDSDCEIVEVLSVPRKAKPEFNPKTVFLNKELSIKIAKKPNESKKLDIKGRHTVWINDNVMVKKVIPTQSFLAQDSRNKKPPDNIITMKMVSDFFENYHHQKVLSICAPFVSRDWLNINKEYVCNYFTVKPAKFNNASHTEGNEFPMNISASNATLCQTGNIVGNLISLDNNKKVSCPESLFTLCFNAINSQMKHNSNKFPAIIQKIRSELTEKKNVPETLFRLCVKLINKSIKKTMEDSSANDIPDLSDYAHEESVATLKSLCYFKIALIFSNKPTNTTKITALPLKSLCYKKIVKICHPDQDLESNTTKHTVQCPKKSCMSLKSLCYERIVTLLATSNDNKLLPYNNLCSDITSGLEKSYSQENTTMHKISQHKVKSLLSLCLKYIQSTHMTSEENNNSIITPKSLQRIAFETVKGLLYPNDLIEAHPYGDENVIPGLMINCVNTLSEEAFLNLEHCHSEISDNADYNDFDNEDNFEPDLNCENNVPETSWISKLQMQELRSCINVNNDVDQQLRVTQIKVEPEDIVEHFLESIPIKSEPIAGPDEMTIIPDVKSEIEDHISSIHRKGSYSCSADEFENFIACNKLTSMTDQNADEIYSQRSERIRMQHEPDDCDVNNTDTLNLLVPHTYENMNIQTAKGSLMQSSSDESNSNKNVKNVPKKVKHSKGRSKKSEQKSKNELPVPVPVVMKEKEKNTPTEVVMLTRRMKEKIRQEQKRNESSDSEIENVGIRLRSRNKKVCEQTKDNSKATPDLLTTAPRPNKKVVEASSKTTDSSIKPSTTSTKLKEASVEPLLAKDAVLDSSSKEKKFEIQCNNVDSTEQFEENTSFTGFTSIETNEMSNYEKCLKYVYERVIPQNEDDTVGYKVKDNVVDKQTTVACESKSGPIISPDEPIELLQCEPAMPILEELLTEKRQTQKKRQLAGPASKKKILAPAEEAVKLPYIESHGWHCYPVDSADDRLYENACVFLEKLPESFVQTYFQYQNITTNQNESDEEINRLTNLHTLNRASTSKEKKPQNNYKQQVKDIIKTENISEDEIPTETAMDSDHYEELLPSDDESSRVVVEVPPVEIVQKQTENSLAKNLLMNDNDSEDDANNKQPVKIKTEDYEDIKKSKKKITIETEENENLMLTADKMMTKELSLLHAPVVLDDKIKASTTRGPVTRQLKKMTTKTTPTNNKRKTEEDSSSEEEKQWVSTKEKLLKKMGKKDSASADDAKRAKLVSEFIERREGNPDAHMRRATGKRSRRSAKKFLEREKQLRVLQRELFGEMSNDPTISKRSVAAWKGRRNIRKVLDKKSLARSTVVANMEEFERKKRLNARQTKLRELLGCEEGVNVLVINDEVCLEYDFEEYRPVVTIHPFFTKVMKAHQYEGVKFMWDACFESLAEVEAGHPGGGCILAHCMGLGKTLQVLALLHTVLTHPRVGMRRILVCCPLSTVLNWVDEIHKWIGPVTNEIKVFELSKLKKTYERAYQLEDWYNGGGIFIIGYELFRSLSTLDPLLDDVRPTIINKIRTALLDPGPDIVVCDEGHLLKNDASVLAVAMSRVVTKRRIVLTGTPMQNNLREYYCMVNFVKPNLLGTYSEYSNRFENPIMNGQHRDSSEEDIKLMKARTHILHKVLEGCLQRQEASVLYPYLPKKHEYTVFINLTQCQWDLYKHYLNHYSKQLKHNSILKDFHILQKIWSHPQVLHNFQTSAQENRNKIKLEKLEDDLATEDLKEDLKDGVATELWWLPYLDGGNMLETLESSNKFVVVFRILEECVELGDKVLIFSTSLICLNSLEYFLKKIKKWSLGQEYYRLDGSVPAEVRQKWCREFNAENNVNTKLFLVSTRAGCLGLNMTAANRVIIMDTSWNPAHDIQSIFRVYRFGQKKDCFIYRLVAMGTMEQKIYERSVTKQAVACRVVDEQQIDRHYNMAELTELYRYDETGSSVTCGVAVGVRDVALLRVARDATLHAVHEHDSLLRSSEQGLPEHERAAAWMQFQQEQADKQLENNEKTKIPKISLKRVHGQNYAKAETIKREIKTDDTNNDFIQPNETRPRRSRKCKAEVPFTKPSTSRTKTSRIDHSTEQTLATPGPSQEIDLCQEQNMVQKISEILLKHNFHNKKTSMDVVQLLSNVKRIVKQGYVYPNDGMDTVTASIAQVLLSQGKSLPMLHESISNSVSPESAIPGPEFSVIAPEPMCKDSPAPQEHSSHEIIVPDKKRKRKVATECREQSVHPIDSSVEPESILGVTHNNKPFVPDSRKKRRAAIAAEKQFDLLSQDIIINLDDEYDATDTDFVPELVEKLEKQPKVKRRSNLNETVSQEDNKNYNESTVKSRITFVDSDTEINEPKPVTRSKTQTTTTSKPGPKTFKVKLQQKDKEMSRNSPQTVKETLTDNNDSCNMSSVHKVSASTSVTPTVTVDDTDEKIPLPLSLLRNNNFINIVAHTYLNGNPMLDADAATLAAKYSTFKALKEAEQSGKDIVSGAIYDIAVKVIGKDLFKKMTSVQLDNTGSYSPTRVEDANVTIQVKESSQVKDADVTIKLKDNKEVKCEHKYRRNLKSRTRSSREKKSVDLSGVTKGNDKDVSNPSVTNSYSSNNVVPVGMIQSAGSLPSGEFASSESILPHDDDDDMLIISSDIPARMPTNSAPMTPTQSIHPVSITPKAMNSLLANAVSTTSEKSKNSFESSPYLNHSIPVCDSPPQSSSRVITIAKGKVLVPSVVTSGAKKLDIHPYGQTTASNTICLDSDDDESLTPVTPLPSLQSDLPPVSAQHKNNDASDVLSVLPEIPTAALKKGVPKKPLVLRQISVGNAQKFILVPAQNFDNLNLSTKSLPTVIRKNKLKETTELTPARTITQSLATTTTQNSAISAKRTTKHNLGFTTKHESATKTTQSSTTKTSQSPAIKTTNSLDKETTHSSDAMTTHSLDTKKIHSLDTKTTQSLATKTTQSLATKTTQSSAKKTTLNSSAKKTCILATTTPSAACLNKLKEARCEPGDIIKISDKGEIQVLQKKTTAKSMSSTSGTEGAKSTPSESASKRSERAYLKKGPVSETPIEKAHVIDAEQAKVSVMKSGPSDILKQTPNEVSRARALSISSSSSESRPASPLDNNPLSILKNVVHIQAAEEKLSNRSEKKSKCHKSNIANIYISHDASESTSSAKDVSKDLIVKQQDQIKKKTDKSKHNLEKSIKTLDADNKMLKDLLNKKSTKSLAKVASSVKGGLKSIAINEPTSSNKKIIKTLDLVGLGSVKSGSGASMLATKIEITKRGPNTIITESSPFKRRKSGPMTLEDFNIDDIDDLDDIIELE